MNGLDVLVFTAGIGENSVLLRQMVYKQLTFFGVDLDEDLNQIHNLMEQRISRIDSKVQVLIIPTNEQLMIARETYRLVKDEKLKD